MTVTFLGVRHHSPACARLVAETIARVRPAHVLIEGPADFNDRIDELLLGHTLPLAIFSYQRGEAGSRMSWTPFCDYSPEWVALTEGRAAGARVRFIDLPAWHDAFADRGNRYADAELRYAEATDRLCREFAVDNVDTLWDHMVEAAPESGLAERLAEYFDLVRGDSAAPDEVERERYMAQWVRAAREDGGPVVVVTGGFHRPALITLAESGDTSWPTVPEPPGGVGGSYLVPYSHQRLDAFEGYQSGMPSPGYYQRLWEVGAEQAATDLIESVVTRLRGRRQPVSTADLIAARTLSGGLARMRGHRHPTRTDVLDGLVSALVADGLDQPLPWTTRGSLLPGAHPAVVEMVAAATGDSAGRLHPDTPAPPLLNAVARDLADLGLDGDGLVRLDLTDPDGLRRSRLLHRLRVIGVPGFHRDRGPTSGADPVAREDWTLSDSPARLPALIEAAAKGATLADAAAATLAESDTDVGSLAAALFNAALCGLPELSEHLGDRLAEGVGDARDLGALGQALAVALGLWRHDRLFGVAGDAVLGTVIGAAAERALWLAEGIHGGPAPADRSRIAAMVALRDAVRHAGSALGIDAQPVVEAARRIGLDRSAPPDLRGAAVGLCWSMADPVDPGVIPEAASVLGDWLAGLFALAREEVLRAEVLPVLDDLVSELSHQDFLVALPALRQAFEFFPPAEREAIAKRLLARRGLTGSARALLRTKTDPLLLARAAALEAHVDDLLTREGLLR